MKYIAKMGVPDIDHALSEYADYIKIFEKLLASATTKEGIAFARLWINRCECSILHMNAIKSMKRLEQSQDKATVNEAFSEAARYAREYARHYSERMPDRGGEGHVASYTQTIPRYIESKRDYFLGLAAEAEAAAFDAPPTPLEKN